MGGFGLSICFFNPHHSTIVVFQVNGTLVTHSNHIEVVKLIKCKFINLCYRKRHFLKINPKLTLCLHFSILAGSYVALTVLGRPPGLAQIPLSEAESQMLGVSISSPNSPAAERPYSPQDRFSSSPWVLKTSVTCIVSHHAYSASWGFSLGLSVFVFLLNTLSFLRWLLYISSSLTYFLCV